MNASKRAEVAMITVVADCCLAGLSTRRMDKLVKTLGIHSLLKSHVSRMAADTLTLKVREGRRLINAVVMVATKEGKDADLSGEMK